MKVIIAVGEQKGWQSRVSKRFGRANGFYLVEDKNILEYIDNSEQQEAAHGAGVQSARQCVSKGAKAIITGGDLGPKAQQIIEAAQLEVHGQVGERPMEEVFNEIFAD